MFQVLHTFTVLIGVSILTFVLLAAAPGDFFSELRLNPQISPETVASLRVRYGADRPLPVRYARWLVSVARGELGYSAAYNQPVSRLLARRLPFTLLLTLTSLVIAWALAIPLGIWAAARRRHWDALVIGGATTSLLAVPDLIVAVSLVWIAARTQLLPTGGASGETAGSWTRTADLIRHLALPVIALTISVVPFLVRHVHASVLGVLNAPYILAARARGVPRRRVLYRSALRAAAHPLVVLFGLSLAAIFSGSLTIEVVTGWPGLGPLMLDAVAARDQYVVLAGVMVAAALLLAGNLIADALLIVVDPRIEAESHG